MAYDTERKKYSKRPLWIVEIEGDGNTWRFCQNVTPFPAGLDAVPCLSSIPSINAAQVDWQGGIGVRAGCSVSLNTFVDYTFYGSLSSPVERFWVRWRAENPYYLGYRISTLSGYLTESGAFDESNFVRRDYIIESFSLSASGVTIKGKDPLKLASDDRAKAPVESLGALSATMLDTDTTFTLTPAGVGDSEYPASNGIVRIGDEVMLYTTRTGDTVSGLTRGYYNTEIGGHDEGDTVQLCLYYDSKTVDYIDNDLLTTYAGVDPSYIPTAAWATEVSDAFPVTYSCLITEPTGVQELLEEFGKSAPHSLYYDDRNNLIQLKAIKPPPSDAVRLNYDGNFLPGTSVEDMQDMRISTVICRFGIINPVKDLDEASNYRVVYSREDTDSVSNYGQRMYHEVNSRWIPSDNQTAAVLMEARVGRRFSEAPRKISVTMDAKDADVWVGDSVSCQTDLISQVGGGFPYLYYQVTSAKEGQNFEYTMLEHTYGPALPQDEDVEDENVRLIYIAAEVLNLRDDATGTPRNLREYYEDVVADPTVAADLDIRFIFEANAVAGSEDNSSYSVETGSWPELTTPILIQNAGKIIGYGGDGRTLNGEDGGPAILLQDDIRLNNLGIIGGGGGGGGGESNPPLVGWGGGGAGYTIGESGTGEDGTYTEGGEGTPGRDTGKGGDLGQDGGNGVSGVGGSAGKAIDLNGYAITYISTGTILGAVS